MGFSRQEYWRGLPRPSPEIDSISIKHTESCRDFIGGPVFETLPSNAEAVGPFAGQEGKIPLPRGQKKKKNPKHETEAILQHIDKVFKNGPHKKSKSCILSEF